MAEHNEHCFTTSDLSLLCDDCLFDVLCEMEEEYKKKENECLNVEK